MIHLLFDRFSKVVLAMEIAGIPLMVMATVRLFKGGASAFTSALLILVIVEYVFIRYCASRRWYRTAPRWSGIEKHFKKALVPTSYIIAILGACLLLFPSAILLGIAAFLLAVVAHVNVILLYLHLRNRDETPANYFSGGAFLKISKHPVKAFPTAASRQPLTLISLTDDPQQRCPVPRNPRGSGQLYK